MIRWAMAAQLRVNNQPGTLARMSRVFSERGINLGDILAVVGDDRLRLAEGQVPVIVLTFNCTARLQSFLHRRIERMPEVATVTSLQRTETDERPVWELLSELGCSR
jgi:acetolactate synthase small subunit